MTRRRGNEGYVDTNPKETASTDQQQPQIRRKRRILKHTRQNRNFFKICQCFRMYRSTSYFWKHTYEA